MFSHIFVGSNDLEKSKTFYDAIFAVTGGKPGHLDAVRQRITYAHNGGVFMVAKPIDGAPATFANGGTIGFSIDTPALIDAWHDAGVAAGGTACEDPPGIREGGGMKLYLAYLRDPDGNKLCGLLRVTD